MAALDELNMQSGVIDDYTKRMFAAAFWIWYYNNKKLTIPIKIWFIRTSVSIEQLYPLFVLLFGEDTPLNHG
jgi:hypothetical protein